MTSDRPKLKQFARAFYPDEVFTMEHHLRKGLTPAQAQFAVTELRMDTIYRNDKYQVAIREADIRVEDWPMMVELSIKRIDREPIHDWRELQEIKNVLVGVENEAIELYPAESRKVDTANQYYLFALVDPDDQFPFGFRNRSIATPEEAKAYGAKQRPFQ